MGEDVPDDLRVFDEADDAHGALAFRTDQRIDLVYFLNQPCPIFPEDFIIFNRFSHTGDDVVRAFLFPFASGDVAVIAIVSDHLFAPVGDV